MNCATTVGFAPSTVWRAVRAAEEYAGCLLPVSVKATQSGNTYLQAKTEDALNAVIQALTDLQYYAE